MRLCGLVLLVGCGVSGPDSVTAPDADAFSAALSGSMGVTFDSDIDTRDPLEIDLDACRHERVLWYLPFGSAWFLVHPVSDDYCEMWLGGETEDPRYNGRPDQYCLFDRHSTLTIEWENGGPILLENMPWCVLL